MGVYCQPGNSQVGHQICNPVTDWLPAHALVSLDCKGLGVCTQLAVLVLCQLSYILLRG